MTHEENVKVTRDWISNYFDNERERTNEELMRIADEFCKWEEENMPKNDDGEPDWTMVVEHTPEDTTYVVVHDEDFGTRIASDWAECLEVFYESGNLPKVIKEY